MKFNKWKVALISSAISATVIILIACFILFAVEPGAAELVMTWCFGFLFILIGILLGEYWS
ncbi:MAG: hypothetical protein Q3980_17025 [Turicibacter sp.]|nr:hypothetical protein [Turicibacter sp.]